MNKYLVSLTRSYEVEIEAKNPYDAKKYVEFYIGDSEDLSTEQDRKEKNFKINDIQCNWNQVLSVMDDKTEELIEF